MHFQFIRFGGSNEHKLLYSGPLTTEVSRRLKSLIENDDTNYGNTDYNSGIDLALEELRKRPDLNSKTLFLSDAEDHGTGPRGISYQPLGDVKFIIYGSGSVETKGWLKAIPWAIERNVDNEFEVTALFVTTLFEFVDNLNHYLIRRGKQRLDVGEEFVFAKHAPDTPHTLIITRPVPSIEVDLIIGPLGTPLSDEEYHIYQRNTFVQIVLDPSLSEGEYRISFRNASRSFDVNYINFEPVEIYLDLSTIPPSKTDCLVENSSVNFEFKFWDNHSKTAIQYVDFLGFAAYRYQIIGHKLLGEATGTDPAGLIFSKTLKGDMAGQYDVLTAWSYNEAKLKADDPPLEFIRELCITQSGRLIHVEYDTSYTWEGRDLAFTASFLKPTPLLLDSLKSIYLNTDRSIVELRQAKPGTNEYTGSLKNVQPVLYQLSIDNRDSSYSLALDSLTVTQFEGKPRRIVVEVEGIDFQSISMRLKGLSGWDKLVLAFKEQFGLFRYRGHTKKFSFEATDDLTVPFQIPYAGHFQEDVNIDLRLNKIFPDEVVTLSMLAQGDSVFECSNARIGGVLGFLQQTVSIPDAVTASFAVKDDTLTMKPGGRITQKLNIEKKKADMDFDRPLYVEPQMQVEGVLTIDPANQKRSIAIPQFRTIFEITTAGKLITSIIRWSQLLLTLFIVLLVALITFLVWLYLNRRFLEKMEVWQQDCKDRSPEDFLDTFPIRVKGTCTTYAQTRVNDESIFPQDLDESQQTKEKRAFRHLVQTQESVETGIRGAMLGGCVGAGVLVFLYLLLPFFIGQVIGSFFIVLSGGFLLGAAIPVLVRRHRKMEQFDEFVVRSCSLPFLQDLSKKLKMPNLNFSWRFTWSSRRKTIFIVSFKPEDEGYTEKCIRTRLSMAAEFGSFEIDSEGCFLVNETVVYIRRGKQREHAMISSGNRTLLESGEIIKFGPAEENPYFIAEVMYTPNELVVVVKDSEI